MWRNGDYQCINRNIVECKAVQTQQDGSQIFVLIETLWNVKKVGALIIFRNGSRINRNIVECKAGHLMKSYRPGGGINRNIVECKDLFVSKVEE